MTMSGTKAMFDAMIAKITTPVVFYAPTPTATVAVAAVLDGSGDEIVWVFPGGTAAVPVAVFTATYSGAVAVDSISYGASPYGAVRPQAK